MAAYTTIDNPELYFQVKLYTGNNTGQSITFDGDEDMQPDMVWLKERNGTEQHNLFDSVRGSTIRLMVDAASTDWYSATNITSFDSDGFTLSTADAINDSGNTMVAWCWKESATSGLDIVSWSGTGSAKTESHSLSAVPHFMWNKNRADATQHNIYHHKNTSAPETEIMYLNLTNATADDNAFWNDTAPTSSVFSVGTDNGANGSSDAMITYLFSEKQGFSKFGSYTGNGVTSGGGPFVYLGFRPAFIIIKNTASTPDWVMFDNKRVGYNTAGNEKLYPNATNAEADITEIDLLSNGFKLHTDGTETNTTNQVYIYMAFAEAPFVNSNGVPCNAR